MSSQLKRHVITSSLWSFVGTSGRQVFGLVVFIILARLLLPEDFGAMAIAVAFVEVINMVVRLGLGQVIVRTPNLTGADSDTAFWLSFTSGALAMATVFFGAGLVAGIFNAPAMEPMLQILSVIPFFYATCTVHEAMLQRGFGFKSLAFRTLAASGLSGVVAVTMALQGYGVYSLVFQRVSSMVVIAVMLWAFVRWVPGRSFSWSTARRQLHIGRSLVGSAFLNMASLRSLDIIIGLFLGTAAVGYLRIAAKLNDFLVQSTVEPVVSVALPAFSKLQHNTPALARAYRRFAQFSALLALPAFLGLAVVAPQAVQVVFGPQWAPSAVLMQILCLAALATTLNYFFKPLMVAAGRQHLVFRIYLLQFILTVACVAAGAQVGLVPALLAYVGVQTAIMLATLFIIRHVVALKLAAMGQDLLPPLAAALAMAGGLLAVGAFLPPQLSAPVPALLVLVPLGVVLYAAVMLACFPSYTRNVRQKLLPALRSGPDEG